MFIQKVHSSLEKEASQITRVWSARSQAWVPSLRWSDRRQGALYAGKISAWGEPRHDLVAAIGAGFSRSVAWLRPCCAARELGIPRSFFCQQVTHVKDRERFRTLDPGIGRLPQTTRAPENAKNPSWAQTSEIGHFQSSAIGIKKRKNS